MRRTLHWNVLILLIFSVPAVAQRSNLSKSGMDRERVGSDSDSSKNFCRTGAMAGAVTLVARHGQIVSLNAVGYQDLESKTPMRTDTIFDIRSITKPVTAIAIMILVEEGRITLDERVEKYVPEFKSARTPAEPQNAITIRHLLTHTAGQPLHRLPETQDIAIKRDRTLADYVTFLSAQKPEYEPGTQHRYSSGGFAVLGRIIEVVSGQPYEQFMNERIFEPLGMKDSFFFIPNDKASRIAAIYRTLDGKLVRWRELEANSKIAKYPGPEFGMYSTARDLFLLCQMMLNDGTFNGRRILSKLSVEAMTQNQTLNIQSAVTHRPAYQGFGWGLAGDPMNDFPLTSAGSFGHNGAFGGIIWIDPKENLIRIFLEHRFGFNNESNLFMAMAASAIRN